MRKVCLHPVADQTQGSTELSPDARGERHRVVSGAVDASAPYFATAKQQGSPYFGITLKTARTLISDSDTTLKFDIESGDAIMRLKQALDGIDVEYAKEKIGKMLEELIENLKLMLQPNDNNILRKSGLRADQVAMILADFAEPTKDLKGRCVIAANVDEWVRVNAPKKQQSVRTVA